MPLDSEAHALVDDCFSTSPLPVPPYLESHYWWAYVRPWAIRFFEREWLVDLILLGNYRRLGAATLDSLGTHLSGKTLQIACCYGDLTLKLQERVQASGGQLDVVDVLPLQLENLRKKLPQGAKVRMGVQDSAALKFPDASYDRALLFFLLHEQPREARARTVAEALRVVKPGGTLVIVDFSKPRWWNPVRVLWLSWLGFLEPFARDFWRQGLAAWVPSKGSARSYFGGLFEKIVVKV